MDDGPIGAGTCIRSAHVAAINSNPDEFALSKRCQQYLHPDRSNLRDIDASIFQRFVDAGPLTLEIGRQRQFWQRLRLRFTQQGICQVEQRIGSSLHALVELLTNLLQYGTVHYVNVLCFFDWNAKNFTSSGSFWQARTALCFPLV